MTAPSTQTDSRTAAIAAFNKAAAQSTAGVNPNAITPEELSVVKAPTAPTMEAQTDNTITDSEAPAEVTAEPKTPIDPEQARRFAQLSREAKALNAKRIQQDTDFKTREAAIAEREAKAQAIEQKYNTGYVDKNQLKQNVLQVLADNGISYDDVTQQILNQQPVDPRLQATIQRLEAKVQEQEDKLKNQETRAEEQQKQSYQAAIQQIRFDAQELIESNSAYELIKATESVDDIVEYIEAQYQKNGRVISVETAAEKIENFLTEKIEKLSATTKIKERLSKAQASAPTENTKTQPPAAKSAETTGMKTLTNATSSARPLTAKERAVLAFKGQLKS